MSSEPADADGQLFDEEDVYEGHSQLRAIFGHDIQTVFDIIAGRRAHNLAASEEYLDYDPAAGTLPAAEDEQVNEPTAEDKIAAVDEPERLHTRYQRRPRPVSDTVLTQEAEWITEELKKQSRRSVLLDLGATSSARSPKPSSGLFDDFPASDLFNERRQRDRFDHCFKRSGLDPEDEKYEEKKSGEVFFPPSKTIDQEVRERVRDCLNMLLNERVDVPFICVHRAHVLFPPLSPDIVWLVYELDEEFWRLKELRESVLQDCLEKGDDPRLLESIRQADNEIVLRDHLSFEQSKKVAEPVSSPPGGKRRRTQLTPEQMFNRYFTETGVRSHWHDRLVKPADLVAAVLDDSMDLDDDIIKGEESTVAPTCRQPPPPEDLQNAGSMSLEQCRAALNSWIRTLIASKSGEKLVIGESDIADMVVRFEGRQYALNPEFRGVVRRAYYRDAAISTLTTLRGEKMIDPGSPEWLASRLLNKPLAQLWTAAPPHRSEESHAGACEWEQKYLQLEGVIEANMHRELGLLIAQCETDKLINVVMHPLSSIDEIPWADFNRESSKYTLERERWEREDGEYLHERERLEFVHKQDLRKTADYVTRFANVLGVATRDTPWKWFLHRILEHAVLAELIPVFRQEVRAKLVSESQKYVALVCKTRLQLQLSAQPLHYDLVPVDDQSLFPDFAAIARAEVDDMNDVLVEGSARPPPAAGTEEELGSVVTAPLVYALVIEPDGDCTKAAPVHLVMANREGLLIKTQTYPHLLEYVLGEADTPRPKDFESIMLSLRSRPNAVVVPLINALAVDLFNYLKNLADTRLRHVKHGWQVIFVPPSVPLLAASKLTSRSSAGSSCPHSTATLIGLSSIHYVVDPVYEVASLWEEGESNPLLSLPLHYLQHKVPAEVRLAALQQVLVRAINTVGVFPNRLRVLSYLAPSLQFVSGLGPVKAKRIIKALQQPLSARETLLGLEDKGGAARNSRDGATVVGSHVFLSCASFLRLQSTDDIFNDRYAELDPLDDTRIHPIDEYSTARKMCRDAQDEDGDGADAAKGQTHTLEETLEDLDLEAYAYILGEGGRPRMLPHLEWLKWEMIRPFSDPRIPYKNMPVSYVLRTLIADETKCRPTASIQLVVETINPTIQLLSLPSNTFGRVLDIGGGLTKSQIIRARLERLNYEELCSYCVVTSKGISTVFETLGPQLSHDPQTLSPLIQEDIIVARLNRGRRVMPAPAAQSASQRPTLASGGGGGGTPTGGRVVRHPCMSPLNHRDLIYQLSNMADENLAVGSVCKFRIGQQKDNLILYMLVNHKPFRFKSIPIEERDNGIPIERGAVAKELHLQGIGTYTSLNEIIARPCSSFQTFVRDVLRHEKFHASNSVDELAAELPVPADGKAQWAVILDPQGNESHRFQERFLIITISVSSRTGAKRVLKDPLVVTPNGYKIWSQQSSSLQHLLNWYKNKGYPNVSRAIHSRLDPRSVPIFFSIARLAPSRVRAKSQLVPAIGTIIIACAHGFAR